MLYSDNLYCLNIDLIATYVSFSTIYIRETCEYWFYMLDVEKIWFRGIIVLLWMTVLFTVSIGLIFFVIFDWTFHLTITK